MNNLEEKILEEIRGVTADTGQWGEYGGQNRESQQEAAKACYTISIEFAKGLANWMAQHISGSYFINNEGRWELTGGAGLTSTDQLIDDYIKTL